MKYTFFISLIISCCSYYIKASNPVDYVNPLMGTFSSMELSNGNTYPTVCLPFGMNNWAPHTGKMGSGFLYTYQTNFLYGFKQTHQASLWINDYGQFSIMPVTKKNQFTEEGRKSWYSHKTEITKPHYYYTYLGDHQAHVEITPTERASAFRVKFHDSDSSYIVIDAYDGGSFIKLIPEENKIVGYSTKNNGGVPENFKNYFVIEFDKPFLNHSVWKNEALLEDKLEIIDNHVGAIVGFNLNNGEHVNFNIATSYISFDQAEINLREIGKDDFDTVKEKAEKIWNTELNKIKVSGGTEEQKRTFYSCFYRMLIFPRKFYEINKQGDVIHYSPYNGEVLPGYMYADNGFWDTFRAQFPFMNLMYPDIVSEVLQGLENAYKESGWLPEWFSPGHRDCMIGSHSASIITDAYMKGIRGYDIQLLYDAIIKNTKGVGPVSSVGRLGAKEYNDMGYVPYDVGINQNVSRTLEYAYNDYCIYQLGKLLEKPKKETELYLSRSRNYKNLFDTETGLMRPKDKQGKFLKSFDPFRWGDHLTEANSWQYTWFVPHDIEGLKKLLGGKEMFFMKLDSLFTLQQVYDISYYKRGVIHLIREMQNADMGQYAHLNEPMHHVPYIYNFGEPWKAQSKVREVMNKLYSPTPDGFCGDEDNGQMSAWYVFSSMGFYPLSPVSNQYAIGSPLFQQINITLPNKKIIEIHAPNNSKENIYVDALNFNGKNYSKNFIDYSDIVNGAKIIFDMSSQPNIDRGISSNNFPKSLTY
ncbi:MAG: GH92 family glycosyl hydrolase [Paludibacter sp.]|nr:GH92 family glycosyl hydrolase [Paludibacter sp.]